MADADPHPPRPDDTGRLFVAAVDRVTTPDGTDLLPVLLTTFNRVPTDAELEEMRRLPPVTQVAKDAQHFAERLILAELAVRLFRVLVLGNIVITDSPAAMDWLRDWIDGTYEGHGPMGSGPMVWPENLTVVCGLLRQWGFQPTPTMPAYVARRPVGPAVTIVEQGKPS